MLQSKRLRVPRRLLAIAPLLATAAFASSPVPTSTRLATSVSSASIGQAVTLSASVTGNSGAVLTGQVVFCDGSIRAVCTPESANLLGVAQITPSGTASIKVRLGIGSHNILARFAGTTTDATSLSNAAAVTVPAPSKLPTLTSVEELDYEFPTRYLAANVYSAFNSTAPTGAATFQVATGSTSTTVATATLTSSSPTGLVFGQVNGTESLPSGSGSALAVGDFNEDGIPDVMVGGAQNPVVYLGAGDGTFPANNARPLPSGFCLSSNSPSSEILVAADLNADGHQDLVAICGGNGTPYSLSFAYGKGDGTFSLGSPVALSLSNANQVLVGDFNGDGRLDLFVLGVSSTDSYALLLQHADHSLQLSHPTLSGSSATSLLAADVNGDGITDLVDGATDATGSFHVYRSNGDGTFTSTPVTVSTAGSMSFGLSLGDFNGDGVVDLAASTVNEFASFVGALLLNNGSGSFSSQASFQNFSFGNDAVQTEGTLTWFDANGDGLTDAVVTGATSYVGTQQCSDSDFAGISNGDGTLTFQPVSEGFDLEPCNLIQNFEATSGTGIVADLNGDGRPDLLFAFSPPILDQTGWGVSEAQISYDTGVPVPGGTLALTVTYGPTGNFLPSTSNSIQVQGEGLVSTTLSLAASSQQPTTLTATLAPYSSGAITTDGESISFTINGKTYSGKLSAGVAGVQVGNLPAGSYSATAAYTSDNVFASATATPVPVTVGSSAPGDPALTGTYVFRFSGALPAQEAPVRGFAAAGWFRADGSGKIVAGEEDLNSGIASYTASALTGSFSLAADGSGTLELVNAQGLTQDFAVVIGRKSNGVAEQLSLLGLGNQGSVLSGVATLQAANPASLALSGAYTLTLNGETACTATSCSSHGPGQVSALGSLTADGQTVSGQLLENAGGTPALDNSSTLALTAPDANGRITAPLTSKIKYSDQPQHYVGYYVDAATLYLISTDPHTSNILLSGSLIHQ